jgi:hypothetical protein
MVGTFLALALGQLLIARADIKAAASFNAIVALFAVALITVTAARAEPPRVGASDVEEPVSSEPVSEPRRRSRRPGNRAANARRGWGSYKKFGINPVHCRLEAI